jgi:uncharacterized protein YjbI with pentapeptide repeats
MADLRGASTDQVKPLTSVEGVVLRNRSMRFAVLNDSRLYVADLFDTYLTRANLSGAYLTGANMAFTDMSGVDLSKADLSGFKQEQLDAACSTDTKVPPGLTIKSCDLSITSDARPGPRRGW